MDADKVAGENYHACCGYALKIFFSFFSLCYGISPTEIIETILFQANLVKLTPSGLLHSVFLFALRRPA